MSRKLPLSSDFSTWEESINPDFLDKWLLRVRGEVLLLRTSSFIFFAESIGEKQHVGSCYTNCNFPLKHPFCFHSQGEKIPDKLEPLQVGHPVAHCLTLLLTPKQATYSQFVDCHLPQKHKQCHSKSQSLQAHHFEKTWRRVRKQYTIFRTAGYWPLSDWICSHN